MAKYKISGDGVKDTETGAYIPEAMGNRHWKEYLKWVAKGNMPDPEFSQEELDQQVLDADYEDKMKLVKNKMEEMAVAELKTEGKLPQEFKLKDK